MTASHPLEATLAALLARHAAERPARTAFIEGDETLDFAGLEVASRRLAAGFAGLGAGAGERVALWLPNGLAYVTAFLACAQLGAIAVSVNTRFRAVEVGDLIARSGARVLAYHPGFRHIDFDAVLSKIEPQALAGLDHLVAIGESAGRAASAPPISGCALVRYDEIASSPPLEASCATGESPCIIFSSSGTTRAPKMIVHTQKTLTDHARAAAAAFGLDEADAATLQMVPLSGVFGFSQMMAALSGGAPNILMPAFDAGEAAALVMRHDVSHLISTDLLCARLLEAAKEARPFPSLRFAGFAAFTPSVTDLVAQGDARGIPFVGLYGSSEIQALFAAQSPDDPPEQRAKAGGRPVSPEARVRVRDVESGALLPVGETGELEFAGPSRMLGYDHDDAATAEAVTSDGFVRSGDLGYLEADGRFVFLTRRGDVMRLGGYLVHPAEIESHIQALPDVEGCQVVAVARPEGARAVAFVVMKDAAPLNPRALRSHCLKGLAKYKLPERFIALDKFPMTRSANGLKVRRARLRELAEAAPSRGTG
jgi:fatty-acyl-CoA synthase